MRFVKGLSMALLLIGLFVLLLTTVPDISEPISCDSYAAQKEAIERLSNANEEDYLLDSKVAKKYQKIAYEMSCKYDVDFPLVLALIEIESGAKADVISTTNDYGLMQINECNHRWLSDRLGTKDFLEPRENIEAGCYMLARYFKVYDRTSEVLMAYNLGGKKANELIRNGIHETEYSKKIMEREKEMIEKEINNGR